MKMYKTLLPLLLILLFSGLTGYSANQIYSINEALHTYTDAHKSFAKNDYDKAISRYRDVEKFLAAHPRFKKYFDHHYRNFSMIELVERHKALGKFDPQYIHKIAVLYINRTKAPYKRKIIIGRLSRKDFQAALLSQKICTKFTEVMTSGNMTLNFRQVQVNSAVTRIEPVSRFDKRPTPDIIINSISPYPSETINDLAKNYDTFLFYWNHKNNNNRTSYNMAHGWGGAYKVPLVPNTIYTPQRGRIVLSTGLIDKPGTIFHELFHTLEKTYGITPIHGFRDAQRKSFPNWKGSGEFDYYQYHYKRIRENNNLDKFMISKRYPFDQSFRKLTLSSKKIQSIKKNQKRTALKLYFEAEYYLKSNPVRAKHLLIRSIKINRYFSPALFRLGSLLYSKKKYQTSEKYLLRAYRINPLNSGTCYMLGVLKYKSRKIDYSLRFMTEAVTLNPGFAKAYQYRGFIYYQKGAKIKAEKDFLKSISLNRGYRKWISSYLKKKVSAGDRDAEEIMSRLLKK